MAEQEATPGHVVLDEGWRCRFVAYTPIPNYHIWLFARRRCWEGGISPVRSHRRCKSKFWSPALGRGRLCGQLLSFFNVETITCHTVFSR